MTKPSVRSAADDDPPLYPPTVTPPAEIRSLLQYLARFVRNPLRALPEQVYHEPVVRLRQANDRVVWVTDPALIETILLREEARFPKSPMERRVFAPTLGQGILTSEGAAWRWQRRTAAPLFRHAELLAHVPVMVRAGEAQVESWAAQPRPHVSAIDRDMTETTFTVISRTILAGCGDEDGRIIQRAGRRFLDHISWPIAYAMMGAPSWLWHPGKGGMRRAAAAQRAAVARLIVQRRAEARPRDDILGRLLAARHPDTGEPMPDAMLADNLLTFLAAGHETTAKALTWSLYLLARAPAWQERVLAEVRSVAGPRRVGPDDIGRLAVTQRVLKEALRLYPPAPVVTRIAAEETVLAGRQVPKGALIVMPIFAIHRHRGLWSDPDRFDPDRFLPDRESRIARTQFMPFGFGPRTCIGAAFAMIEATALLASLVRGAHFATSGRHVPEPVSRVTLRPRGGMPLQVCVREPPVS